jgi:hypothetical protein
MEHTQSTSQLYAPGKRNDRPHGRNMGAKQLAPAALGNLAKISARPPLEFKADGLTGGIVYSEIVQTFFQIEK